MGLVIRMFPGQPHFNLTTEGKVYSAIDIHTKMYYIIIVG